MRSGVECVLFFILIRRGGSGATDDYFRPTPIPLNDWREVRGARGDRAGSLQDSLFPFATGPARYWEDALRHSVYLTLVRDKIDKLIAKGEKYSDQSKEVDERDLWDKIKRAPFDRIDTEDPIPFADVVTIGRGRLMEDHGGFRFTDDEQLNENCTHSKCMNGVKALWAVKRVRQRDVDSLPGHYYELTFSVISMQKKHKKRYEKPARTFTVRESVPERILEAPQEHRYYEPLALSVTSRPDRALWHHKNIIPPMRSQARQHHNSLDRLFSSLFLDDEDGVPAQRHKPKQVISHVFQQHSKVGYVGAPSEHQQKKLNPYGPKLQGYKYARPLPSPPQHPPIQHHYLDIDAIGVVSNPYIQDHRYGPPNKGKTPRPAVLPTPPNPVLPQKNFTIETTTRLRSNRTEETTPQPENVNTYKPYNKYKPSPVKISYVTDHVRPPVYNAPPGVFVTMDKKPFKPMPPLRLVHSGKHHKPARPIDFRPSPPVLDYQFSDPDPLFDTAFRPITMSYPTTNTTERAVTAASDNHIRKSNTTKKPPKKHENIMAHPVTTTVPEIITAHSAGKDADEDWTNVLGAFAKTTPMAAERETETPKAPETTTPRASSTTTSPTNAPVNATRKRTTTTTEAPTTPKPKKRTRPPHKFVKPEKVKKHKRITTTTTEAPARTKKQPDLTPQASSAAATAELPSSSMTSMSSTTSTDSTTTPTSTTSTSSTSTPASPTAGSEPAAPTTPPPHTTSMTTTKTPPDAIKDDQTKRKNRYRQSTLKYRSTSEKLDKKEVARTVLPPTGKFPPRRKGSKFHGHIQFSTPRYTDMQFDEDGREDHVVSPYKSKTETTTSTVTEPETSSLLPAAAHELADQVYFTSESPEYMQSRDDIDLDTDESDGEQESRDDLEYAPVAAELLPVSEDTNEIIEINHEQIEESVVASAVSTAKNKTKCKKKKLHNLTNTTEEIKPEITTPEIAEVDTTRNASSTTTTEISTTPDIFEEIFSGFTFDESPKESKINEATSKPDLEELETTNHEKYIKAEEDFADFFEAFDDKDRHPDGKFEDQYEYDDKEPSIDEEESLSQRDDDTRSPRGPHVEESYEDYEERPYSLLELMAME